jgi:hypothetical protein
MDVAPCPYCIRVDTGGAYAHSALALDTIARVQGEQSGQS